MIRDLFYGFRVLARNRGFAVTSALVLGLGIGVNTAIFSLVNALLLRPLPGIEAQDELVTLGRTNDGTGFDTFSYPDYLDYREQRTSFEGLVAIAPRESTVSAEDDKSERAVTALVSDNYFETLGARTALGRTLLPG